MRVTRELAALRARWAELYPVPAPPDMTAALLKMAIEWTEHVAKHGDISPALQRDLQVIARTERDRRRGVTQPASTDPAVNLPASTRLVPGARLIKVYQGVTHVVEVGEGVFTWQEQSFGSLSAVAKAITGTHWNGLLFFGLRTRRVKPRHERVTGGEMLRDAAFARPRSRKNVRHA